MHQLSPTEMEAARQRVKAAAARKKEKERKAKGKDGTSSSTPKAVAKASKVKGDEKDERPSKKTTITLKDVHPKKKSPPKSSRGAGKRMMTFSGLVIERPCCLLTYKDYVIEEVKSFIKPLDIDPSA